MYVPKGPFTYGEGKDAEFREAMGDVNPAEDRDKLAQPKTIRRRRKPRPEEAAEAVAFEQIQWQVDPATLCVFAHIAQDVCVLQSEPEVVGVGLGRLALFPKDADTQQANTRGHAIAVGEQLLVAAMRL